MPSVVGDCIDQSVFQLWLGFRAGVEDAKDVTGVDEVYDINSLSEYLDKNYIGKKCRIWGNFMPGEITNFDLHSKYLHRFVSSAIKSGVEIFPLKNFLTEHRIVKSDSEVEAIRKDLDFEKTRVMSSAEKNMEP